MGETYQYLLGPNGVFEGSAEDVLAMGFDPWQSQLFTGVKNRGQFGAKTVFDWSGYGLPEGRDLGLDYATGYVPTLLDWRARAKAGTLADYEREQYDTWVREAQAIPLRDVSGLTYDAGSSGTGQTLSGASPDLGGLMLQLADRIEAGTASPQEQALFQETERALRDQDWRASVPQASDAFNPLGDQFFGALGTVALGATGGLAAAPLVAGGASLATTLGSLGTLSGIAGTGAGVLAQPLDQPWLSKAGLALGALGGVAGGVGGAANLFGTGVQSLSDAARLASSAGRITGAFGSASGVDAIKDAGRYLGLVGNAGNIGSDVLPGTVTDWSTQGSPMEWDYSWDYGDAAPYDNWSWDAGEMIRPTAMENFLSWDDPTGPGSSGDTGFGGEGSGGSSLFSSILGGLGQAGRFLGTNASWLGPAVSSLGSLGAGAIGANASNNAADAQAAALNRGLDLQTAQWLRQQETQAPWLAAGEDALGHMRGRMAWEGPQQPGTRPAVSGANYALPTATPGWQPQQYQGPQAVRADDYRYTPGQGPRAADYRYAPGAIPQASQYAWTPGQGPRAADYRYTPGAVPTLQGAELLKNDPGYQFRQDEARRALEASALTRGSGASGSTLAALQRQSSDIASAEYAPAWQRASEQAQLREAWNQHATAQGFSQEQAEASFREQMAQQSSAQNFGQATTEAELRERVNQIASQQGWSQAQAEAAFREQMQQQSTSQNFGQAMQAQGQEFTQGLQSTQWNQMQDQQYETDLYNRLLQQSNTAYGRDVYQNETDVQRQQQAYQQQIAELTRQWNQFASVAGHGQIAAGQQGQQGQQNAGQMASLLAALGQAQGLGAAGSGLAWNRAIGGVTNNATSLLASLNR